MSEPSSSPSSAKLVDDELAKLPRPPRRKRALGLVVLSVTALAIGALSWSLRHDTLYALGEEEAIELDSLAQLQPSHNDSYVRVPVELREQPTLRFRRRLDKDEHRLTLATDQAPAGAVFVAYSVPTKLNTPRFVPPSLVAGRLARAGELGVRFAALHQPLSELAGGDAWVLVEGESPRNEGWVLGLQMLLLAFFGWNVLSIIHILRPRSSRVPSLRSARS